MLRAIRALFPPEVWAISPWTEEHAHGWCDELSLGIIGAAASSKSWDIGGLALLDWLTSPDNTVTIMASTSKLALADRTFASSIKLFKHLKHHPTFSIPGKIAKTVMAIMLGDDDSEDMSTSDKTALRGVALAQGTADEARGSLQGRHAPYVRLVADELAAMKPNISAAVVDARTNLSIGAEKDFKFVYLANPETRNDTCGKFAEPIGGWDSVDENTPSWRTLSGLVIHHNGFFSPAVLDPDGPAKYPFLIRKDQIDAILRGENGNTQAAKVWTMIKGFPRPMGAANTVLTQADIETFKPCEDKRFMPNTPMLRLAAFDPAFSSSGDGAAWITGELGTGEGGGILLRMSPVELLPIDSSSKEPASYQCVRMCVERCRQLGIAFNNIAIDDSGTQSVADIWLRETGQPPVRYNYASKSSDPQEYSNLVTEMWYKVQEWVRSGGVSGLGDAATTQFCSRVFKKLKPKQLEPKPEYKTRTSSKSPDQADATAMLVMLASTRTPQQNYQQELDFTFNADYSSDDLSDTVVGDY
jgi:hypothetical protein